MRVETRLIKKILKKAYPNEKINITYRKVRDQITNGDRIYIKCRQELTGDVINFIRNFTTDIIVTDNNLASSRRFCGNILDEDNNKWIETDVIFIFVNSK